MAKRNRRALRRRRAVTAGGLAAVGATVGLTVSQLSSSGTPGYRTATATTSSVTQTLDLSGTVEPVTEATPSFQVSGTIDTVAVTKGDHVTAGQTLATVDTTSFETAITEAKTTLAADEAKLTEDEEDESSASSTTTEASGTSGSAGAETTAAVSSSDDDVVAAGAGAVLTSATTPAAATTPATTTSAAATIAKDQAAVVSDQHDVDTDMATASADLADLTDSCPSTASSQTTTTSQTTTASQTAGTTTTTTVPASSTSTTEADPSTTDPSTADPSTTDPSTADPSTTDTDAAACTTALTAATQAEQAVDTDETTLQTAETNLADALSAEASTSTGTTGTGTTGTGTSRTGGSSSGSSTASSGTTKSTSSTKGTSSAPSSATGATSTGSTGASTSTDTDTPEQLASDESTIDSQQASLVEAEQTLAAATLVSPVSGTVEAVDLTPGESVSGGSTTDTITVMSVDNYEVSGSLTTSEVQEVKVGQAAAITVDGTNGTLSGTVSEIGPVSDSDSSYTYPVLIDISSATGQLATGGAAQATIDLAGAQNVLVVPTSAVHTSGTTSYVYLDRDHTEVKQQVTVGLVGDIYTQIKSGLSNGEVVVLANSSVAVPSSSTNSTTRTFTGSGGFGGGFTGAGRAGEGGGPPSGGGPGGAG